MIAVILPDWLYRRIAEQAVSPYIRPRLPCRRSLPNIFSFNQRELSIRNNIVCRDPNALAFERLLE